MRIFTTVAPLFAAEGCGAISDDKTERVIFLFASYDAALKKATELLYQHYSKVSVYRVAE